MEHHEAAVLLQKLWLWFDNIFSMVFVLERA